MFFILTLVTSGSSYAFVTGDLDPHFSTVFATSSNNNDGGSEGGSGGDKKGKSSGGQEGGSDGGGEQAKEVSNNGDTSNTLPPPPSTEETTAPPEAPPTAPPEAPPTAPPEAPPEDGGIVPGSEDCQPGYYFDHKEYTPGFPTLTICLPYIKKAPRDMDVSRDILGSDVAQASPPPCVSSPCPDDSTPQEAQSQQPSDQNQNLQSLTTSNPTATGTTPKSILDKNMVTPNPGNMDVSRDILGSDVAQASPPPCVLNPVNSSPCQSADQSTSPPDAKDISPEKQREQERRNEEIVPSEICNNGADDDADGKVDFADSECSGIKSTRPNMVLSQSPEDSKGFISGGGQDTPPSPNDVRRLSCKYQPPPFPVPSYCYEHVDPALELSDDEICNNGVDDDKDGKVDEVPYCFDRNRQANGPPPSKDGTLAPTQSQGPSPFGPPK